MFRDKMPFLRWELRIVLRGKHLRLNYKRFLSSTSMLIVLGIDHRRPGPFTKREDDVRRTSRMRGRSHSFWIPVSRSYGRSISCHVALKSIRESSKGKGKGLQGYCEDRREPSIFRTQLFKNPLASPPSLSRRVASREFRRRRILLPLFLSPNPCPVSHARGCCYINRNPLDVFFVFDQINIFFTFDENYSQWQLYNI